MTHHRCAAAAVGAVGPAEEVPWWSPCSTSWWLAVAAWEGPHLDGDGSSPAAAAAAEGNIVVAEDA